MNARNLVLVLMVIGGAALIGYRALDVPRYDCATPACAGAPLPRSPHAVLLTPAQWENTVRDLLRLPAVPGLSDRFPVPPAASGGDFGNDSANLVVSAPGLWEAYRDAAETVATRVAADPTALARVVPDSARRGDVHTRARVFVADLLPRAYRRPVEDEEIDAIVALGQRAAALDTASDPFIAGLRWMLTAVLQTPSFLYRIEGGVEDSSDGRTRLGDYEIAAKLSYALWGTMPDDRVTRYAQSKKLATRDGVAALAREMLDDPRAASTLMDFHEQLFGVDKFEGVVRQTGAFPTFYPEFGRDAREDVRRTIREIVIDNPGTMKDLYSSDVAYVNANLAKVYGIDPATIEGLRASPGVFVRVRMPDRRAGILMHVGWLAMEARAEDPSPIQRGVFMARRALCIPLGSPPPGAINTKIDGPPGANNRGRTEATTERVATCKGCHGRVINPMGFAFEGFDAIGATRTRDGASAVDTTGATELLGSFDGPNAMLQQVEGLRSAHACYAAHWSAYLNGTPAVQAAEPWLLPIVDKSTKGAPVRDIVAAVVQTDTFLTVSR